MFKKNLISLTIAATFVILAFGSVDGGSGGGMTSTGPSPATASPEEIMTVPIGTLLADYENNEVGADIKYKGKILRVTGKAGDIKKDILDHIYVTVGTGKQFEIPEVQAFFDDAHTAKAASLKKGQQITVQGRCEGLMMNVLMKDSVFIE
jgi:hypothetical protein